MSFHLKRNLAILTILILVVQLANCQDDVPPESEEEDDSSSEETVEDSNESNNRRRRSAENGGDPVPKSDEVDTKPNRAIPGLPDPATILKIAEILTTVGQEVLPMLVQGNGAASMVTDRLQRDVLFFKNFKNELDMLLERFQRK